jgi:toxin ParE1/3/4
VAHKVRISIKALRDLDQIGERIALESPAYARRMVKDLLKSCHSLNRFPERFARVRRFSELRRMVHGSYLIFCDVSPSHVDVIHVLHGATDYEKTLFPEDGGEN